MNKNRYLSAVAAIAVMAISFNVSADQDSYKQCSAVGDVSGWVKTVNLDKKTQTGFVKLRIKVGDKIWFDKKGVVIGEIVGVSEFGAPILEHSMFFGFGNRVHTNKDMVLQMDPTGKMENGVDCEFKAAELISEATGTRKLRPLSNDQHAITASGIVSYCSDNNSNSFKLSGSVCLN